MTVYLTTEEAAERTKEKPATWMRRCAAGLVPATKVGKKWLIAETVIEDLLAPSNQGSAVRSTASRRRSS